MKCPHRPAELAEYAQGIASPELSASIAAHIHTCKICSAELSELQAIFAAMKVRRLQPPQESYWTSLLPRIHERIGERSPVKRILRGAPVVLPALVVMFLVIFVTRIDTFIPMYDSQQIHAIVHQMADNMLQEVDQNISVEESSGPGRLSLVADETSGTDKEVLLSIFQEGETTEGYSDLDQVQSDLSISDDEAGEVVARLQSKI